MKNKLRISPTHFFGCSNRIYEVDIMCQSCKKIASYRTEVAQQFYDRYSKGPNYCLLCSSGCKSTFGGLTGTLTKEEILFRLKLKMYQRPKFIIYRQYKRGDV